MSKSYISKGKDITQAKKSFIGGRFVDVKASLERGAYFPGSDVPITISVVNQSGNDVKSIQIKLQSYTESAGGKKSKPVTTGVLREYTQKGQFPLQNGKSYEGSLNYKLPQVLKDSTPTLKHQLALIFDCKRTIGASTLVAYMPITIASK